MLAVCGLFAVVLLFGGLPLFVVCCCFCFVVVLCGCCLLLLFVAIYCSWRCLVDRLCAVVSDCPLLCVWLGSVFGFLAYGVCLLFFFWLLFLRCFGVGFV